MHWLTRISLSAIVATALLVSGADAGQPLVLRPDEPASKDGFAYQWLSTTDMNLDYYAVLCAANTGSASQHSQQSFLQFDLSGVGYGASAILGATLDLHLIPTETTGFGASPSAAYNLDVSVREANSAWLETLTWNSRPTMQTTSAATLTLEGDDVNNWISFDITDLVKKWLSTPDTNRGVGVVADEEVRDASFQPVMAVFESASTSNKPALTLNIDALPGDTNLDGQVDIYDLRNLAGNWQRSGDAAWLHGDFDGDLAVTNSDLGALAAHWQDSATSGPGFHEALAAIGLPPAVPEPSLAMLAAAGFLISRSRPQGRLNR